MTKQISSIALSVLFGISVAIAQQSPGPASPSPASAHAVRISFLPPPLEGKISLGIYNEFAQLVRVLHQEAQLDEFTIGADALVTKWDGKDDYGFDSPAGKYRARGFLIAPMKIEEIASADESAVPMSSARVKLVANPLENNDRPTVDLAVGFDDENTYLKTVDGLPLITVATTGDIKTAAIGIGRDNKIVFAFLSSDAGSHTLRVVGVDKMMAFDGGEFELK